MCYRWPLTTTTCVWCKRWRCLNMHWNTRKVMTWPRSSGTRALARRWVVSCVTWLALLTDTLPCHIHLPVCMWIMDPHSRAPKKNTKPWKWGATARYNASHTKTMLPTGKSVPRSRGNWTTRRPPDHCKETQTAVVWSCLLFIRSGRNHLARFWKGEEDKVDRGRGGKTTSGNGQAWSSPSPRGQWRTGKIWRKLVAKSSVVPQWPSWLRDRWWWWWWWQCAGFLYLCGVYSLSLLSLTPAHSPPILLCVAGVVWSPHQLHPLPGCHVNGGLRSGSRGQVGGFDMFLLPCSYVLVCLCVWFVRIWVCVCGLCMYGWVYVRVWLIVCVCVHCGCDVYKVMRVTMCGWLCDCDVCKMIWVTMCGWLCDCGVCKMVMVDSVWLAVWLWCLQSGGGWQLAVWLWCLQNDRGDNVWLAVWLWCLSNDMGDNMWFVAGTPPIWCWTEWVAR